MMIGKWPYYSPDEITVAVECLTSGQVNYWTGNQCKQFEREFAEYHGVRHAVALANGTVALEIALEILGVVPGDEVIVTPRSFFASASCVARLGATPVFADVDEDSQNLSVSAIRQAITKRTKAIIPVHLAGWPSEMEKILKTADEYGVDVIEDCAQAHGARLDDKAVGSFGRVAAFSFCQDKIMSTAGEGGMLLTDDTKLYERAWSLKDHGKSRAKVASTEHPPGFRWLHESIGSNLRMTEIQGAVGRLQLTKLDDWVSRRNQNAQFFIDSFSAISALRIPEPPKNVRHAYYKFYAFIRPERIKKEWSRERILSALEAKGCPGLSGSCPEIYKETAFEYLDAHVRSTARKMGETSIMLPVHPTLVQQDLEQMAEAVIDVFRRASVS